MTPPPEPTTDRTVIAALDLDDRGRLDSWLALLEAHAKGTPYAVPVCRTDQEGSLLFAPPSTRLENWVLVGEGGVLGSLRLAFVDGQDSARVDELVVHPDHRRRGAGRSLIVHAAERARLDGRTALVAMIPAGLAPDEPTVATTFAGAVGAEPERRAGGLRQVLQVHLLRDSGLPLAVPPGLQLVHWGTVTPEQWAGTVSLLETTLGEGTADQKGDPSYARRFEQMRVGRGRRAHHTGVVDLTSGSLLGYTSISMTATQPGHALQGMTVVHEKHRGRRLGMLLKGANLLRVLSLEPGLEVIETTNDEDNAPMVGVNVAMGFVPVERREHWALPV